MRRYHCVLLFWVIVALAGCGTPVSPGAAVPTALVPPPVASTLGPPPSPTAIDATIVPSAPPPNVTRPYPYMPPAPALTAPPGLAATAGSTTEPILGKPVTAIVLAATVGPAATPGPVVTPIPLRGPTTITSADNEQTVYLAVGDTFGLALGAPFTWHVRIGDERIVAPVPNGSLPDGAQGVYKALAPGQTELFAEGAPACAKAKPPCLMPDILFHLTIVVR